MSVQVDAPNIMIEVTRNTASLIAIVDRQEKMITRVADIQGDLVKAQAVAALKMEALERISSQLADLIEKRREETEMNIRSLHERIDQVEHDLSEDVKVLGQEIVAAVREVRQEIKSQNESLAERILKLERWRWMILGGSIAIGFLLAQLATWVPVVGIR